MRTFKKLFVAAATLFAATVTMAQNGFNYQAVIRDADGNLVANQSISLRITLLSGNTVLYVEEKTAATNAYGVVSVVVGEGGAKQGSFNEIDWSAGNISMKTEFDPEGGEAFEVIGTTQLHSVPTAEYAKTTSAVENPKNIKIQATNETGEEEALFEVKDKDGNVVFAVYNDGVRVYVDDTNDGSKAAKSGFAVAGRSGKAGEGNTYFAVNDQGTQVYVDDDPTDPGKAAKAKFAVAGKSGKADDNYLVINKAGTQIYVDDEDSKAAKAKFAVAGKSGKADDNLLVVNQSGTKVYVDDDPTDPGKAAKAKFAVAGKSGKGDDNYLVINKAGTQIYVDDEDSKAAKAKFAVAGKSGKADDNLLVVNQSGTKVYVDDDPTDPGKAAKAKFAVAGKSGKADGSIGDNYLVINDEGTKVFVDGEDGNDKAPKSKFAVSSVRSSKADQADDFFLINNEGTKVFIDETPASGGKAPKSKFAVSSVKSSKTDDNNSNYFVIDSDSTRIYIDEAGNSKAAKSGFAVAGKSASKAGNKNLFNIDLTQTAEVINDENRVYWYPKKNAFMAGKLNVTSADSVGENSFNAGYQNKAIGDYSQALGFQSRAKGEYATAIGKNANADKDNAYAFGNNAKAIGTGSYAIGADAEAKGTSSFALGSLGQDSLGRVVPSAKATGDFAYAIGAGTYADGFGSVAMGISSSAIGDESFAVGKYAYATNKSSVAIGGGHLGRFHKVDSLIAEGGNSSAIGYVCKARGDCSTAIGYYSRALGFSSTALGYCATASGDCSAAIGYGTANGNYSAAIGESARADGDYSVAIGSGTKAISIYEVAIGAYNTEYTPYFPNDLTFNAMSTQGDLINYGKDRLFVIGNGNKRVGNNALIIYKNGNAELQGDFYPSTLRNPITKATVYNLGTADNKWNKVYATNGEIQTSDKRLKTDIKPLEKALDKVLTLNGVTYSWRVKEFPDKNFDSDKHVGVLAQEVEAVLPEAVETGEDGFKSVNYSNITPLLIEAVKEQQGIIEKQQKENDEMKARMEKMEKMLEELMKKQ